MDVQQHHYSQRDVVSSLHERLSKGEKIVRSPSILPISGGLTIA